MVKEREMCVIVQGTRKAIKVPELSQSSSYNDVSIDVKLRRRIPLAGRPHQELSSRFLPFSFSFSLSHAYTLLIHSLQLP